MRCTLLLAAATFLFVAQPASAGDEADTIKKAVLVPQKAAWEKHDFKAYLSQWADDCRVISGRTEREDKHDVVLDRKQIEATRRIRMSDVPRKGTKLVFESVEVKVDGDQAELRARATLSFDGGYLLYADLYRLRKTPAGWKATLNRSWPLKLEFGGQAREFNAETWRALDAAVDELVRTDPRGDKAAEALFAANRFAEELALRKRITARADAAASDWVGRGFAALTVGDSEDAVAAFRQALKLDAQAAVPQFVRGGKEERERP